MRLLRFFLLPCLIWALLFSPASAGGSKRLTATGDQLRALFVQRLVKYVSWPAGMGPEPGQPVVIAATDPGKLRPYFNDNSSQFKIVSWPAEEYHVLVLTGAPEREAAAILKRTAGRPVLTIGQNPVNLRLGVVVNFYMVNGKLRLQVSPKAAEKAGITISSRLLNIAQIYAGERE